MGSGSSGGGSTQSVTQTTKVELPKWAEPYAKQLLSLGSTLSQMPYSPYPYLPASYPYSSVGGSSSGSSGTSGSGSTLAGGGDLYVGQNGQLYSIPSNVPTADFSQMGGSLQSGIDYLNSLGDQGYLYQEPIYGKPYLTENNVFSGTPIEDMGWYGGSGLPREITGYNTYYQPSASGQYIPGDPALFPQANQATSTLPSAIQLTPYSGATVQNVNQTNVGDRTPIDVIPSSNSSGYMDPWRQMLWQSLGLI